MEVRFDFTKRSGGISTALTLNPIYGEDIKFTHKRTEGEVYYRDEISGTLRFLRDDFTTLTSLAKGDYVFVEMFKVDPDSGSHIADARFTPLDVEWDYDKQEAKVTLQPTDKYDGILSILDKEVDLVKLAPPTTSAIIRLPVILQLYELGDNKVTNIVNTSAYEVDIDGEPINDGQKMRNYGFGNNPIYGAKELTMPTNEHFDTDLIGKWTRDDNISTSSQRYYYNDRLYVVLPSVLQQGVTYPIMNSETGEPFEGELGNNYFFSCDESRAMPSIDYPFYLSNRLGATIYKQKLEYDAMVYARFLMAKKTSETHDRLNEDLTKTNLNYRYTIGLESTFRIGYSTETFEQRVKVSNEVSSTPTQWGKSDDGLYFVKPTATSGRIFVPFNYNKWIPNSFWFEVGDTYFGSPYAPQNYWNEYLSRFETRREIRDCYTLGTAIKAICDHFGVADFAEDILHSQFLYDASNPISSLAERLFITPISNIKSSYYSVPAQQGKITLKDIFDMLKNCFQCYWVLDDDFNLQIEHILFFRNGNSYDTRSHALRADLTSLYCPRVGKTWAFGQNLIKYNKTSLPKTYTFGWGNNATEEFNGYPIEINEPYVDGTQDNKVSRFLSDIDYIVTNPDDINNDLYALIATNNGVTPLPYLRYGTDNTGYLVQNGHLSFHFLANTYWNWNLSGSHATINGVAMVVAGQKRIKKQVVKFPYDMDNLTANGLIRTDMGDGEVISITENTKDEIAEAEIVLD